MHTSRYLRLARKDIAARKALLAAARTPVPPAERLRGREALDDALSFDDKTTVPVRITLSRNKIVAALVACDGRSGDAARMLGISLATLRRRRRDDLSIDNDLFTVTNRGSCMAEEARRAFVFNPLRTKASIAAHKQLHTSGRVRQLTSAEIIATLARWKKRYPVRPGKVDGAPTAPIIKPSAETGG